MKKRGGDFDGSINDYTSAILLKPNSAFHRTLLGDVYRTKKNLDDAITEYSEAIRLKPDDARAYNLRGITLSAKGDNSSAFADFQKASELEPKDAINRASLVRVLIALGRKQDLNKQEQIAQNLIREENEYNQACFEAIYGNTDKALGLLKIGLEKEQSSQEWARRDPDFESIRNDPRFKELVGE